MYTKVKWSICSVLITTTHILLVSPEKQMIHCAAKGHHVQLIASKKNATVMQDMKAVPQPGKRSLAEDPVVSSSEVPLESRHQRHQYRKKNYLECRGETCI